mgnify:FL=1
MILLTNNLPKMPADDGGIWRRTRVVRFESSFVANPDPNNENEYKMDTDLNSKLEL